MIHFLKFSRYGLLLIVVLSTVLVFSIVYTNLTIYDYDTQQNYQYPLQPSQEIVIKNQTFVLHPPSNKKVTAFLKLNLRSCISGYLFQPFVTITSGKLTRNQYFEHGTGGIRYLNVSDFISAENTKIDLIGNYIAIDDQDAALTVFENIDLTSAKILIIAPHPDDAEIAAHGLYNTYKNSFVLTLTLGDGGSQMFTNFYKDSLIAHHNQGKLRSWNSITTPLASGISPEHVLNLGYFDGTLSSMYVQNPAPILTSRNFISAMNTFRNQNISSYKNELKTASDWPSLIANLKSVIGKYQPDVIVTPYPALDIHPDHKYASIAIFQALKELKIQKGALFLYSNHYVLNEYYPYGPSETLVTLPPNFKENIYFNSIYSNPLSFVQQKDKYLALESMYALRSSTEWQSWQRSLRRTLSFLKKQIFVHDYSYYRRAVRNNELFFVVPIQDLSDSLVVKKLVNTNFK